MLSALTTPAPPTAKSTSKPLSVFSSMFLGRIAKMQRNTGARSSVSGPLDAANY